MTYQNDPSNSPTILSQKRQAFCREYVRDFNATQAAIRAGYSPKTAYSQGSRLLKNVEVQREIQRLGTEIATEAKLDARFVVQNLLKNYELASQARRFSEAIRVLELLGKHLGMWKADRQQTEITAEDRLAAYEAGIDVEDYLARKRGKPH